MPQDLSADIALRLREAVEFLHGCGIRESAAAPGPSLYASAADTIEAQAAEIARLQAERDAACKLVADMHYAGAGSTAGPRLGVIEDIAALRAERNALRTALETIAQHLSSDWPGACQSIVWIARTALKNAAREST